MICSLKEHGIVLRQAAQFDGLDSTCRKHVLKMYYRSSYFGLMMEKYIGLIKIHL